MAAEFWKLESFVWNFEYAANFVRGIFWWCSKCAELFFFISVNSLFSFSMPKFDCRKIYLGHVAVVQQIFPLT